MRGEAIAGLVVVAILMGAGAGYLYGSSNERTVTSISTTTANTTMITTRTYIASVGISSMELVNQTVGSFVSLRVNFTNTGDVPIYYCWGGCSIVAYEVHPTNATARASVTMSCVTGIPAIPRSLGPGQTATGYSSPCYKYCTPNNQSCQFVGDKFVRAGPVTIDVVLQWSLSSNGNSINATASQTFTIA